jgi:LytS/YehU family sensor histidine kinase
MATARARRVAVVLGVWSVPVVIAWSQTLLGAVLEPSPERPPAWRLLALAVAVWWYWAAWTPGIAALLRRFPLDRPGRARALAAHAVVALAAGLLHSALNALGVVILFDEFGPAQVGRLTLQFIQSRAHFSVLTYWATVGVLSAVTYARQVRERERTAADLRERLTAAELTALKAQLHPHFLFNTLHAIGVLIREDPTSAGRMVTRLGDLLRRTLEGGGAHEVPLRQEIEILQLYLDIQRTRFADRLTVRVGIPDELLDAAVPAFMLQPLVENAIRYGVESRPGMATIWVEGSQRNGSLVLAVRDDGPGLRSGYREGIGIANTRARLAALYGPAQDLVLTDRPGGGAEVVVRLPLHPCGSGS